MEWERNRGVRNFFIKLEHRINSKISIVPLHHRFSIYYNVCLLLLIFFLGICKIRDNLTTVFNSSHSKTNTWVKIIESVEIIVFVLMILIVTTEALTNNTRNQLEETDLVRRIREYLREPIEIQNHTLLHTIFYSVLSSVLTFQFIFEKRNLDYKRFFLFMVGQFYLLKTELHFISIVLNVRSYYKFLNRKLIDKLRGVNHPAFIFLDGNISSDFATSIELRDFSNAHWSICKFIDFVNQTHSLPLFSVINCIFYKLTFIPYLLSLNLINAYAETIMKELTNACLLSFHFAELLLLVLTADSTTKEAKRTRIILCEYMKPHMKEEHMNDIEIFLLHFPVHKAEFRIFNLFILDKQFVLSMFGVITTYMVIFIQLQDTFNVHKFFSVL